MNGFLCVLKPPGMTSSDVVVRVRRKLGRGVKVGHAGTLDPEASGVLPLMIGRAARLFDYLVEKEKTYVAQLKPGYATDTQDAHGAIIAGEGAHATRAQLEAVLPRFIGDIAQIPPMYSALKVNGKKLYELAREGQEVERKARRITIHEIRILEINLPEVKLEVTCSKGTYIRTLCHDIGNLLGTGGCMEELTRTKVGRFELKDSLKLEELRDLAQNGRLEDALIPLDQMFSELQSVVPAEKYIPKAYNGNDFFRNQLSETGKFCSGEKVRVYDAKGHFIGIYRYMEDKKMFHLVKMFLDPEELR